MLWLALHLPALSLESWAATRGPDSAGRPLALLHEHRVLSADALALARGVRPGMKRATALALAPDLLWSAADARRDAQALRAVADVALGFSPSVSWATPADWRDTGANPAAGPALVGVRLEVQSCLRYFGGLPRLLDRLRQALAVLGHQVHIASAPTALGAALLAAWQGDPACRADWALGPHSTHLGALQPLLDTVPLALLGPGPEPLQALQGMGLHTLGDLRQLPRAGLARRFGPTLLTAVDRARGDAPEAHDWLSLPACFASRIELMARADTSAQVLAGAQVLLARLVAWAGARQARIVRFTLVMHHEPRHRQDPGLPDHTELPITPAEPAADANHLHSLLAERLGRLPMAAPALELSLHCTQLVAGAAPNSELFPSRASEREGLARLVERLQARLGAGQVQRLAPVADHRPEYSTRWLPADPARLGALPAPAVGHAGAVAQARTLATQPLWLLSVPQPLAESGQRPLLDGRPLQLLAGPDRLETGWWDGGLAVRDYFIAQAGSGALVWIYRHRLPAAQSAAGSGADDGAGGPAPGWFLQGRFA